MQDGAAHKLAAGAAGQTAGMSQGGHVETGEAPQRGRRASGSPTGLEFPRFFSTAGTDPFDQVEWELRDAVIGGEKGQVVFEQRQVEMPRTWSQQATNIVVSKYFRGHIGSPERERSVKQLIGRVVDTITEWARKQKYFASDEALSAFSYDLKHLLVEQKAASPARCRPGSARSSARARPRRFRQRGVAGAGASARESQARCEPALSRSRRESRSPPRSSRGGTLARSEEILQAYARRSTASDVRRDRSDSRLRDGVWVSTDGPGPAFGILMTNVVPTPGVDSTSMSPLCS